MITLEEAWPAYGLSLRCGDLELRVTRDEDLPELIKVALDGVHAEDAMPFLVPWTRVDPQVLPREYCRFHWRTRVDFSPEKFELEFVVRVGGEVVGTQGLHAGDLAVTRSVHTGSWLGRRFHGRGIGTRMRQMVCAFAFDTLGATEAHSGAFTDNPASLRVSAKVGYRDNGEQARAREGRPVVERRLILRPEWFVRPDEPVQVSGAEALLAYLGLSDEASG